MVPTSSLKVPTSVPLRSRFLEWITWKQREADSPQQNYPHRVTRPCRNLPTISGFCRTWHLEGRGSQTQSTVKGIKDECRRGGCGWKSTVVQEADLIVVRAVGRFFHRGVFFVFSNLYADHRVHVLPHQLPGFNHCHAHLEGIREGKMQYHQWINTETQTHEALLTW